MRKKQEFLERYNHLFSFYMARTAWKKTRPTIEILSALKCHPFNALKYDISHCSALTRPTNGSHIEVSSEELCLLCLTADPMTPSDEMQFNPVYSKCFLQLQQKDMPRGEPAKRGGVTKRRIFQSARLNGLLQPYYTTIRSITSKWNFGF
jgi:hypothetical protein